MANFFRILYYLGKAMKRAYWSRDKLRRYQEKRLRSIAKNAYESVAFYREKFRKAGVTADDIKTLDDLEKLPIVRKDELRHTPSPRLLSKRFNTRELKFLTTSGSTGKPFRIYINKKEDDWRKAIYMRANISCGQKPRDRWVVMTAPRHFRDTPELQRRLGLYAQTCISVFASIDEQIRLAAKGDPDILDGYSGSLLLLAKEADRRKLKVIHPRIIFGTAEVIDIPSRRYIERTFGAPYYDQYGCAEVDRTAWQCPEKTGYHMDVDSVITEFVDTEGANVSAGEKGEIVHTSLFNYVMPFIRYAVGDVGVPSDEGCSCGRKLPLMKTVEGRRDSFIFLPSGQVISPRAFTVAMSMFKYYDRIEQFRFVQKRSDLFEVQIKRRDETVDEETMEPELVEHIKRKLALFDVEFEVMFVDEVPLDKSGRLRAIISELKSMKP